MFETIKPRTQNNGFQFDLKKALILLLTAFTSFLIVRPIESYDIWWHLNSGLWMLDHGVILDYDIWSFTRNGERWLNISWLFQLLIATMYHFFGMWGLYSVKIICVFSIFSFLAYSIQSRQIVLSYIFSFLILAPAMFGHIFLRPHMFAILILTFMLWISRKPFTDSRVMISFLALVLWANCHSSAVVASVAFSLLAIFGYWKLDTKFSKRILVSLLFLTAPFITPTGLGLIELLFAHGGSEINQYYLSEWLPHAVYPATLWLSIVIIIFFNLNKKIIVNYAEYFLIIFFLYFSYKYQRFELELAIVLFRPLAEVAGYGLSELGKRSVRLPVLFSVMLLLLHGLLYKDQIHRVQPFSYLESPYNKHNYPFVTIKQLKSISSSINRKLKVINDYAYGGYISFLTKGTTQVLVDGRMSTVFPESLLISSSNNQHGSIKQMAKRYDADGILLKLRNSSEFPLNDSEWVLVGFDKVSVLFIKRNLAEELGWQQIVFDPSIYSNSHDKVIVKIHEHATKKLLDFEPDNPRALSHMAYFLSRNVTNTKVRDEAFYYIRRSLELDPYDLSSRTYYSYMLMMDSNNVNLNMTEFLEYLPPANKLTSDIDISFDLAYASTLMQIGLSNVALKYLYPVDFSRRRSIDALIETWKLRFIVHYELDEVDEAENCLEIAYELARNKDELKLEELNELVRMLNGK